MAKTTKTPEAPPRRELETVRQPPASLASVDRSEAANAFLEENKAPREAPRSIPIIAIDHRSACFALPSGELVESISGYPILKFQTRRWYEKPPKAGEPGKPPDCWSTDMIAPAPESLHPQAAKCLNCPQNEWGTSRSGTGKACATQTWLFLLNPEFGHIPIAVVVLPPSSIRALEGTRTQPGYLGRAEAKYGLYEIVWTTLRLEQLGDAVKYCVVVPTMGPPADAERGRQLGRIAAQSRELMEAMRGQAARVSQENIVVENV